MREIDEDLLAVIAGGSFHPVTLVYVDWPDDPVRVHSGAGTLSWDGHDWQGLNGLGAGAVTLPAEEASLARAEGMLMVGGDPERFDEILDSAEEARGAEVRVFFGAVTEAAGTVLIGAPVLVGVCHVDSVNDAESDDGGVDTTRLLSLTIATGRSQRSVPGASHSWHDQRRVDPDDTAGRWVGGAIASLVEAIQKW